MTVRTSIHGYCVRIGSSLTCDIGHAVQSDDAEAVSLAGLQAGHIDCTRSYYSLGLVPPVSI